MCFRLIIAVIAMLKIYLLINSSADMIKTGLEIETVVLARALQLVFNDRSFIHQNKTIVLEAR